jgi:hypothetical protein
MIMIARSRSRDLSRNDINAVLHIPQQRMDIVSDTAQSVRDVLCTH